MMSKPIWAAFLCMAIAGCGSDDSSSTASDTNAGAPCTTTKEGAAVCDSKICLGNVKCLNGTLLNVCAGDWCGTGVCPTGQQCIPVKGTADAYCVPPSICE